LYTETDRNYGLMQCSHLLYIADMWDTRNTYKIHVGKQEGDIIWGIYT